jgi:sphingolipid delta-4 desaturase
MGKGGDNSSKSSMRSDFHWSTYKEPHVKRHNEILKKHPEIEKLYGPEPRVVPFVLAIMASQFALAYYSQYFSNTVFFLVAWIYGGAASHALSLMTHELSHDLVFPRPKTGLNPNEWFGIFCNTAMGIPSSTMFKRYHMDHHLFQGDDEFDMDLPTQWEGNFFTNTFLKAIWLLAQPLFYALRPIIVKPKKPYLIDNLNTIIILTTDALIAFYVRPMALVYLVLSTLLGMGFHPVAGHFIAEHYVFDYKYGTYNVVEVISNKDNVLKCSLNSLSYIENVGETVVSKTLQTGDRLITANSISEYNITKVESDNSKYVVTLDRVYGDEVISGGGKTVLSLDDTTETYSYYGALNYICWNVGYHNEHHDFPKVAGWNLPKVKAAAPEFYNNLHEHKSWTYVLWRYITDPTINPFSRVRRIKTKASMLEKIREEKESRKSK